MFRRFHNSDSRLRLGLSLTTLILLFFAMAAKETFFITADIGRHLTNGKLLFSSPELLTTNFYSYTYPDFPFLNHHWGSGVFFFSIFRLFGYSGLAIAYMGICLLAILILFLVTRTFSGLLLSFTSAVAVLPLIAARNEIRPECFSLFFCSLFYLILLHWKQNRLTKAIYALPVCMIFWANLHVYFFFGFFIYFCFLLELFWESNFKIQVCATPLKVFFVCIIAALVNPFGFHLLLTPFQMFQNFGYMLQENQSVYFLWNYGLIAPEYYPQLILSFLCLCALISNLVYVRKISMLAISVIAMSFCVIALGAVRNISFFGLFALPYLALSIQQIFEKLQFRGFKKMGLIFLRSFTSLFFLIGLTFFVFNSRFQLPSVDLRDHTEDSADFFKSNHLHGPIFNNYDIGAYLIYNLFPSERVFVDNRPEAYPASFFQDTYIPMQENEVAWKREKKAFGFNVIFFYWHDLTSWGQRFLVVRTQDPEWVPIYVDSYALILVKNTDQNQDLINRYQLPRTMFSARGK